MSDVELLLVRIDHFQDRAKYVSVLRKWLKELQIVNGRLISLGTDVQLLFVAASETQTAQLREFYRDRAIDTNRRGELCVDKFIDVLGVKKVKSCSCKGFAEMNVLSSTLLQKLLVQEWQAEQEWLDTALATARTKAFLEWKEAAKAARKNRRKRERQEKEDMREVKRAKREQEEHKGGVEDNDAEVDGDVGQDEAIQTEEGCKQQATRVLPKQRESQQESKKALGQEKEKVEGSVHKKAEVGSGVGQDASILAEEDSMRPTTIAAPKQRETLIRSKKAFRPKKAGRAATKRGKVGLIFP